MWATRNDALDGVSNQLSIFSREGQIEDLSSQGVNVAKIVDEHCEPALTQVGFYPPLSSRVFSLLGANLSCPSSQQHRQ
jgi:hypothetical protein